MKALRLIILTGVLGALAPSSALGQAAAPPSAASAKPKADKPSGKDKKDAKAADAGAAADAAGLPSGHPPVDNGLPAGHPSVENGEDDEDAAPADPHGGSAARDPRFFKAPPDSSEDDPALPVGTIVASLKDAQDKPIPGAPLILGILHSSVAKGDSSERRSVITDNDGNFRFDGLTIGSGTTYRISTTRGPATYALAPFGLNDRVGKHAVLHSYDISSDIDSLSVGMQGVVYIALREDSIQIDQFISVFNLGAVSWIADTPFTLPAGFKAFNKQDTGQEARVDEVKGTGAALRGTFPPGRRDLAFRYQVPLNDEARQTIRIEMPPHVAAARVMAESGKSMGLEVPSFPPPQAGRREGKRVLTTERQIAARGDGALSTLEITLTGLPTPGPGRWIAASLAVFALIAGFVYFEQKRGDTSIDTETRDDLLEAREALLSEIVTLERAHKSGEIGPKSYARLRAALIDSLARIVSMLDAAKADEKKRRREARSVESAS